MRKVVLLAALCLSVSYADADQIEMSSTLNPVGSGARAIGMGGAFIGVADDATAASWNPAGLVQLEKPEVSIVYSLFYRKQAYDSNTHPEVNNENNMDAGGINYASAAYPFVMFNRNMVVSLNYQRLYEMNKEVDFKYTWDVLGDKLYDSIKFKQEGYLYAVSPAMAVQVTPEFYLGAAVNFWDDFFGDNGWENTYESNATGVIGGFTDNEKILWKNQILFQGINANFGFLWSVYGPFTIGGVYKTPFDATLTKTTYFSFNQDFPSIPLHNGYSYETSSDIIMRMPESYGIGLSYRHSDAWTTAFDIYQTRWSRFLLKDSAGKETNPIDGASINEGRLKDTTQLRLGAEYLFIKEKHVIPLRAGLFYDPEPAKGDLDDYYGFSLGAGLAVKKIAIDAAYQYRTGEGVTGDISSTYVRDNNVSIQQHVVMVSAIYYF
ncbi:MAG: outer membrane protein transport protein [Nitrospirae bacterium]|nr:outer membrane protein transport protein [Nitrospirota bacterium]